jgi:hypothetical protein
MLNRALYRRAESAEQIRVRSRPVRDHDATSIPLPNKGEAQRCRRCGREKRVISDPVTDNLLIRTPDFSGIVS